MTEELTLSVKAEQITGLVSQTNEALSLNKTSVEKAKQAGFALLEEIETKGMSDPMDERANAMLVKIRKTGETMMSRRKPVTQMFDQIKKVFTGLESELDPKSAKSVYAQIQACRDTYAADKAAEAERIKKEAERKLAIENEKTEVRAKLGLELNNYFEDYLQQTADWLTSTFNKSTLADFERHTEEIKTFPTDYPRVHFDQFNQSVRVVYIDQQSVSQILAETKSDETFKKFAEIYWQKIDDLKLNLIEKMPGKKAELEAIAEAEKKDKAEADRLKAQQAEREREERIRQAKETEERRKAAELEAEQKKASEQMQNIFEATPTETVNTAQVRTGYEISVTHQKGWIEIFNFWFLKAGFDLPIDEIGRKSLDQMKTFCQNYAAKEGEKINSSYLKYKETFKTVARA